MSSQTIEHLIDFIYRGEVKVQADELNEFLSAAKALQIKDLTENEKPNLKMIPKSESPKLDDGENVAKRQKPNSFGGEHSNQNMENQWNQSSANTSYGNNSNYYDDGTNGDDGNNTNYDYQGNDDDEGDYSMNDWSNQQSDNYYEDATNDLNSTNNTTTNLTKKSRKPRKRRVASIVGFDTVAFVQTDDKGKETLYHDGFKFCKVNSRQKHLEDCTVCWRCTKDSSQKCKATASSRLINGTIMMKLNMSHHTCSSSTKKSKDPLTS